MKNEKYYYYVFTLIFVFILDLQYFTLPFETNVLTVT